MKRYSIHIITVLCYLFLASCTDEEQIGNNTPIVEGIPTTVKLAFNAGNTQKIETKADDISDNDKVHNLTIFIFDKNTEELLEGGIKKCTEEEIQTNNITLNTTSGERLIYAVANTGNSTWEDINSLETVKSLTDLKNLQASIKQNVSVLDEMILMSGCFEAKGNLNGTAGLCSIPTPTGNSPITISGKIKLKRIVSSIRFNISCTGGTFVPSTWQIKNLPEQSALIEQESDNITSYFDTEKSNRFESFVTAKTNSFAFLMMENKKRSVNLIGINSKNILQEYDKREKAEGGVEMFVNAPENSSYLILKGTYTGKTDYNSTGENDNGNRDVTANVTYYVHLGYLNKDLGDYSISRNNQYIYTLTIASVDKIILEVTKKNDFASGDGQIYMPNTPVKIFDAHYETTILSFKKSDIEGIKSLSNNKLDEFKKNFQIVAATPKNSFDFNNSTTDLDWVEFRKNPKGQKTLLPYRDAKGNTAPSSISELQQSLFKLTDNEYDSDGYVHYTCYINEYYYNEMDIASFVNAQNRIMQINYTIKNAENSASASTLTTAAYVLSQRSIQTIYALDKASNGWGVEWKNESGLLKYNDSNKGSYNNTSLDKGWDNMVTEASLQNKKEKWNNKMWNTYIVDNNTNEIQMQETYKYAYAACLSRNRDIDRDGVIDKNEVRWYLPAINQYVALWMGAPALNPEYRLYPHEEGYYHYVSNTTISEKKRIIWSEEGSSLGNLSQGMIEGDKINFRCVRNLRRSIDNYTDYIAPLQSSNEGVYAKPYPSYWEAENIKSKKFEYPNLNSMAVRKAVTNPLGKHNELAEENYLPQKGFYVLNKALDGECPTGWRVPNQRELTILTSYMLTDCIAQMQPHLLSCTTNSDNGNIYWFQVASDNTYGNISRGGPYGTQKYRCVKDVQ